MHCVVFHDETDLDHWRDKVRPLLAARILPDQLGWRAGYDPADLFSAVAEPVRFDLEQRPTFPVRISKSQMQLCERVLCHRAPERFHHLYTVMLRLQSDPNILDDPRDASGVWVRDADKSVRRDRHKMHAFVRFKKVGLRETTNGPREVFVAWFEPDHRIVNLTADFFRRRFTGMDWSILTPDGCSHWNGEQLTFSPGVDKSQAPDADDTEDAWKTYYSSIFNPSRVKIGAMMAEMPKKYWKNLPEADLIPSLIQQAESQRSRFMQKPETQPNIRTSKVAPDVSAAHPAPAIISTLEDARAAAARCTQCALHSCATQTVFGEGPIDARIMLVGEQPGDQEDLAGRPFVGPAGQLLDRALNEVGLDRDGLYVTNAVKHFKFEPRGKRRLHRTPIADEIERCRSWLNYERQFVKPEVIVALGKTALRSVTGHTGTLKAMRGQVFEDEAGAKIIATVHPSYLLRLPDLHVRQVEHERFMHDLAKAKALLTQHITTAA